MHYDCVLLFNFKSEKNVDSDEQEESIDHPIPFIPSGDSTHSRLKNEFEIMKWLGKGGFGDVIKVHWLAHSSVKCTMINRFLDIGACTFIILFVEKFTTFCMEK